jgi:hypothetical protein
MEAQRWEYDVAISFAGEDRPIAEALANTLRKRGVAVFYDRFEKSQLWGKNLVEYLATVYAQRARYCIVIVSRHYPMKKWTRHEMEWLQQRRLQDKDDFLLPLRIDDAEIPGLPSTVAYLNWSQETVESIAEALAAKLTAAEVVTTKKSSQASTTQAPSILGAVHLDRLDETTVSAILSETVEPRTLLRIRADRGGQGGCHLSLHRGKEMHRVWAYREHREAKSPTGWGRKKVFWRNEAEVSCIADDRIVWYASGKLWMQKGTDSEARSLEIPAAAAPGCLAVCDKPCRVALTSGLRLCLFDGDAGSLLAEADVPNAYTGSSFDSMWFSPQGLLVTGKYASQVLWDASTLARVLDLDRFKITAHYVSHANAFDPTGRLFACLGMGQHLVVVNLAEDRLVAKGARQDSSFKQPTRGCRCGRRAG